MPDVVEDARGRLRRSRRLRTILIIMASVSLLAGGAGFYVSLRTNYDLTHQALADARTATHHANVAAAEADAATARANAAIHAGAVTRLALCRFVVGAILNAPHEVEVDARELARAYRCPLPKRS